MVLVYIVLVIELILILPMASILKQRPHLVPLAWQLVAIGCFLNSAIGPMGLSVISWPFYAGHTKGAEITIIDITMVVIYLSQRGSARVPKIPFRLPMKLYFCAVLLSAFFAQVPQAALFYAWQILRMYFVFIVLARSCRDERVVPAIMKGFAIGLAVEVAIVFYERLLLGDAQPNGTFPHQNTLGMISNMVFLPFVAVILSNPSSKLFGSTALGGLAIAIATASRATMAMSGLGSVLIFLQSFTQKKSPRKIKLGLAGLALGAVLVPLAFSSFQERLGAQGFDQSQGSDYDERAAFVDAASMMLTDHPWGVGANNFVIVANTNGYYEKAGVAAVFGSRSGHVHNIYWLTLTETGYLGFAALALVFFTPAYSALRNSWRFKGQPNADLLGGIGITLVVTYIHSNYEWLLITALPQYFLAILLGMAAGLSMNMQRKYPKVIA